MSLAHGIISNMVLVVMEPHVVHVRGREDISGVEQRLLVQGNLPNVTRQPLAMPMDLSPLFRGAPKVSGLPGSLEIPAFNFPKALLAMSLPEHH